MILTADQLRELTGYRRAKEQLLWLRKNGIRHYVRGDGKPAVLPADLAVSQERSTVTAPRFDALQG